jgi:hypothetical protein
MSQNPAVSFEDPGLLPAARALGRRVLDARIPARDLGILPMLLACPIMYFPKVLDGDTQPWVLFAGLIALFTYRTERFANRRDWPLALLALGCIAAYAARAPIGLGLVRNAYTYVAFAVLWVVCDRDHGRYLATAVRLTVIVWFAAGVWEYLLIKSGYDLQIGRFVAGRSGVPGLTPEPSYYGSLSMIQLMYLLSEKRKGNGIYVFLATSSVVLSGSVLAILLLLFPLWKLRPLIRFTAAGFMAALIAIDFYFSSAGIVSRLAGITTLGTSLASVIVDPSLNLRAGHIYFTLYVDLIPALLLRGPVDFMSQYNGFAAASRIFIPTGSDFILPALGEMIYGSGLVAVALLLMFLHRSLQRCRTFGAKFQRFLFIMACMLNPISLSNVFLIIYAQAEE